MTENRRVRGADIKLTPGLEEHLLDVGRMLRAIDDAKLKLRAANLEIVRGVLNEDIDKPKERRPSPAAVQAEIARRRSGTHRVRLASLAADVLAAEREYQRFLRKLDSVDLGEGLGHLPTAAAGIEVDLEDGRDLVIKFGDRRQVITLEMMRYCGVWNAEKAYRRGDCTTSDGALWIAREDKPDHKPGNGGSWAIAAMRGKPGRDAAPKIHTRDIES